MTVRRLCREMSPREFQYWRGRERAMNTLITQAKNKEAMRQSLKGHRRGMGRR